jgi:DNA-binding beta-propeller fold protein YncE
MISGQVKATLGFALLLLFALPVASAAGSNGSLVQKAGLEACVSETGAGGLCTDGRGLDGARSITVSPDGNSAYVTSILSDAVAVFDRNTTTGVLTQKAGPGACVSEGGEFGCTLCVRNQYRRPLR